LDFEFNKPTRYPEDLIKPMRDDLIRLGVRETRTPKEVDDVVQNASGTTMVVVNSVCGCAAGKARPGIAMALQHKVKPNNLISVFAGADVEATARAREHFAGYAPSSPSIAIMENGQVIYMLERHQIEGREAPEIASLLTAAFDKLCVESA
jgi:putative YphP/YqiW family bacilliredoxin